MTLLAAVDMRKAVANDADLTLSGSGGLEKN
jgi:hypothetical protein